MTLEVRRTEDRDRDAVLALVRAAFARPPHDGAEEVDIVRTTWRLGASVDGGDLVAVDNGAVVGHVLAALGDLAGVAVPGIAPLAVRPDHQRQGVGVALMHAVLTAIEATGAPAVLLLGNPAYYGRFGFEPAEDYGISYSPVPGPDFQIRWFNPTAQLPRGTFRYCWEL